MSETWEETKVRLRKQGIVTKLESVIETPKTPRARYDESVPEVKVDLYEVRKITLPIDSEFPQGKIVVSSVEKDEAEWWVTEKLKIKSYQDDTTDMKTLVFYEKFLIGGTPKERSIYSNPARFCTVEFPDLKLPKRIN